MRLRGWKVASATALGLFIFSQFASAEGTLVLSKYRVYSPDASVLKKLSEKFEISGRDGSTYDVIIPAEAVADFKAIAPRSEVLEPDVSGAVKQKLLSYQSQGRKGIALPMLEDFFPKAKNPDPTARYHSFQEVMLWMRNHSDLRPNMVEILSYGTSGEGNPLSAMKITAPGDVRGRSQIMLTAATHGDELITVEVLMALVDQILTKYGNETRFTEMLNRHVLFIVPVVNPDGFQARDRYEGGADPNRSYPYPGRETSARPTPSIQALMNFFHSKDFKGTIDFHAHGGLIMYPWGYTTEAATLSGGLSFDSLTSRMASTNGYRFGQISRILYTAPGSSADYFFWKKGSTSLGIEIGRSKVPSPSEFTAYVASQMESTWTYIEAL